MSGLVVVCGAGGGLGQAVTADLTSRGDRVIAVGRPHWERGEGASGAPDNGTVRLGSDLTDPSSVEDLWTQIDALGTPTGLVNLVGGYIVGSVAHTSDEDYRRALALNLDSAWWSCRAAASRMAEAGGGAIVNVASRAAVQGGAGAAAYAVAKAAVVRLSEVLADELRPSRVRVNAILPSIIDTDANRSSMPAAVMAKAVAPEAIARVISFLLGADSWPVSGACIPVYGWA